MRPTTDQDVSDSVKNGSVNMSEVFDGAGNLIPPPKRSRINTASAKGIRLEMSRLYKRWLNGELQSLEMYRGVIVLRQMLDAVMGEELERRLQERESMIGSGGSGGRLLS